MNNKTVSIIFGCIVAILITMFVIAGAMYLLGNILIGWTWLTFDICISISGTMIVVVGTIIIYILDRKDKEE